MKRLLVAAFLMLAGCASGGGVIAPEAQRPIPDGNGRIIVYRPTQIHLIALGIVVKANGSEIGSLAVNEMMILDAAPGQHVIAGRHRTMFGWSEVLVDVKPGETHLVELKPGSATQSFIDGSILTDVVHGSGTAKGGARGYSYQGTTGLSEIGGYRPVQPEIRGPLVAVGPASNWRR